jgi:hypothetical protein
MRRTMDPWSVAPRSDSDLAAGGLMWMIGKAVRTKFQFMGEVGEVAPWEGAAKSSWPLVRGVCAHPSGVPRTATGSGTIVQLGAVPTGKNIYVNLHVLSVAGTGSPTLTAQLQSATTLIGSARLPTVALRSLPLPPSAASNCASPARSPTSTGG